MTPYPTALTEWKVDEVIECLGVHAQVEGELMTVAPLAYCGAGVPLADVWDALTLETQTTIRAAADAAIEERDNA